MKLGKNDKSMDVETISDRLARARHRARRRRPAARPGGRDLRAGILGQDHAGAAHRRRGQKKGGICAFIDAEHALDPVYARKLGVNIDELLISQPDTGEQALEIATRWCAPARSTCW
jgi:recombination protein RecA